MSISSRASPAYRLGGIPEMVEGGWGGGLIDPLGPGDLARNMIELSNATEQVRLEMGHSARKRALTILRHPNG